MEKWRSDDMLRIAVCDDDKIALKDTVSMLDKWAQEKGIEIEICAFENGDNLLDENRLCHMDIIILDIIMPLLNGMDTAKEIRQEDKATHIIFLTSSPEFALESYEVKAKGYLLKPVDYRKLAELLEDCSRDFEREPEHLILKTEFGYQKIYYKEIEYIEAQNKIITFYMRDKKKIKTTETLRSFESKLNNTAGFFKCHRSYIVSILNVDHFNASEITTKSGYRIPIARGYGKAFQEAYFAFMFQS